MFFTSRRRKNTSSTRGQASGRPGHHRGRRSLFEPLEDRRLLAVFPDWLVVLDDPEGAHNVSPNMPHIAGHAGGGFSAAGVFQGSFDLDPGPGEMLVSSVFEGSQDTVIARYTDAGEVLWATQIGGSAYQFGWGGAKRIATDRLGNTYLLGEFKNSVQIGNQSFTGDDNDGYLAKLDANGNFVWAEPLKASNSGMVGIAVDDTDANPANWSVFVTGNFKGTATLGDRTYTSGKGKNVTFDTFVSKVSAAAGDFQWSQIIGGQGTQAAEALAFATSGDGGVYISGTFDTEAKIGNVTLTGPADSYFVGQLDPATGATQWARRVAVAAANGSLAATADGVVMAGNFSGTVDFDPGPGVYNLTSPQGTNSNVGVLKLDTSGNFRWAQRMGGTVYPSDEAVLGATGGMAANAEGHVFLTGFFGWAAADFGSEVFTPDRFDAFLVELDPDGEIIEATHFGDKGFLNAVDGLGNVYVTGTFDNRGHIAPYYDHFPTGDLLRSGAPMFLKFSPTAVPIDPTPSIQKFIATAETVFAGDDVTLSIDRYRDLNRQVKGFNFYLDNGDGVLTPAEDLLVGTDVTSSFNYGWSATVSTAGLAAGAHTFFAEAIDELGTPLATAAVEVNVEVLVPVVIETVSYASTNGAQAISDASGNKKKPNVKTLVSRITVPDSFTIADVNVKLNISHTYNSDLIAELVAPNGTRVPLFSQVGGGSDHFTNTTFDDQASASINNGSGPFSGTYRPQSPLSALNGLDAAGVWKLEIRDMVPQDAGTLHSWLLEFSYEATPASLQMAIEPLLSATTTELKAGRTVLATQQAFAAPASDLQWAATATRVRSPQSLADLVNERAREDAHDDLYQALDLALEAEFGRNE